ncbi:polysaccharide pyruvyl transferase family protein [Maritimibacter dapengensis]|uniref:Polysaccharide pyruvyl transferase family protein n=1 Tax=Maritimibacter dapengensis TaxID=2836868 RepID=A0ABS6T532_9RHOB|nr:polysaccharide pyruvyl transferase family protein [Maritimibacter dapengensis]MBV7379472.1 polysaccharide pyruvyl transferase family protein [Maritimibacter dapengensis]
MTAPLSLYWWNDAMNFGDDLSREIVAHVSGRTVDWAQKPRADMVAIGSVLQGVRRQFKDGPPKGKKIRVWGTGLMHPVPTDFLPHVRMHLVRGPITATLLGLDHDRFGDPGLLASDTFGDQGTRRDRIGFIPHINHVDDPMVAEVLAAEPRLFLIDPRRPARAVVAEIATCAHVVSSSLHGLVVADSYGVPNTWLDPTGIHTNAALKFYDYAAGIERPLAPPLKLGDLPGILGRLKDRPLAYLDGIEKARDALRMSFPAALRADAPAMAG